MCGSPHTIYDIHFHLLAIHITLLSWQPHIFMFCVILAIPDFGCCCPKFIFHSLGGRKKCGLGTRLHCKL